MGLNSTTKKVQDVSDRIRRTFGDESAVQLTDSDILRWVNDGQREITERLKISRRRGVTDVNAYQNEFDFNDLSIIQIESLMFDGKRLSNMDYHAVEEYLFDQDPAGTQEGEPQLWYEYANKITIWPKPTTAVTNGLVILYIAAPPQVTVLGDSLSIPDKHFNALIMYVLAQAYEMDEDTDQYVLKLQQFDAALMGQLDEDKVAQHRGFPQITVVQNY